MHSARSSSGQSDNREITLADGSVIKGGRVTGMPQTAARSAFQQTPTTSYQQAPMTGYQQTTTTQQRTATTGYPQTTQHHQTQYAGATQYQQQQTTTTHQQYAPQTTYQQHTTTTHSPQYQSTSQYASTSPQIAQTSYQQQVTHTHGTPVTQSRTIKDTITGTEMRSMAREISSATLTGNETIIGERIVEHEVKVPKRIVREEVIEKVIVVPERIVHEEVIEETQMVREKVIEVARPIYQEKIIEVPEIEYVEKIVEVPERVVQEKIIEVARVDVQERVVEVPKIVHQEKIVEVQEIEYREIPIEKIVEVPQIQEQVVVREVVVPQYVDKPIPEHVTVEVPQRIERNIPIPVEALTTFEYRLPHIRPHYKKATFPVYVPRFVEVPVPEELVTGAVGQQAAHLAQHVSLLTTQAAPSLCEIENIAADIKKMDLASHIANSDYHSTIKNSWLNGSLNITPAQRDALAQRGVALPPQQHQQQTRDFGVAQPASYMPVQYSDPAATAAKKQRTRQSGRQHRSPRV